jgi:formate hydrogenlyase subunit 4
MSAPGVCAVGLALLASPLLRGLVAWTAARLGGRPGVPLLRPYRGLVLQARAGRAPRPPVTPALRVGRVVAVAAAALALLAVPLGTPAPVAFGADFVIVLALFALARWALLLTTADTGAASEDPEASRSAWPDVLREPVLLLVLLVAARVTGRLSLSTMLAGSRPAFRAAPPPLALAAVALFILLLTRIGRPPPRGRAATSRSDAVAPARGADPGVPGGPPGEYAAALELWALAALVAGLALPLRPASPWAGVGLLAAVLPVIALLAGSAQATLARLHRVREAHLLVLAALLAACALGLVLAR